MPKMKTLVLPPETRLSEVCSERCVQLLNERFDPVWNDKGRDYTPEELAELIPEAEVILTSWGSPILTQELLEHAGKLQAIGHAAGSLKGRIPSDTFDRGIKVFSGAQRIAQSVGEYCLGALLTLLRRLPDFDRGLHQGIWKNGSMRGHELKGRTVGLVSASSTARVFIQLLKPFEVQIKVFDPYLSDQAAEQLQVTRASLEEIMACPIISVHAPKLPETYRMLNKSLLQRIPEGAIFINSSRADVLDEEALIEELQTGRFLAALDVYVKEPLAPDSPLCSLSNVLLTPHVAGDTVEGRLALMEEIVEDIGRSFREEKTKYEISRAVWDRLA